MKKKREKKWAKQEADARKALENVARRIEAGGAWGKVRKPVKG